MEEHASHVSCLPIRLVGRGCCLVSCCWLLVSCCLIACGESPLHEGDMFMLRDLFFVVRRVRAAQEEYDGVVEVRRMAAPGEAVVPRLGDAD